MATVIIANIRNALSVMSCALRSVIGDIASGFVIGKCYKRHRATEFLNFLKEIDAQVPEGLDIHIVMDNYATHKTPQDKDVARARPHYHVHFTLTSASWINQVERWFAELTRKASGEVFIPPSGNSKPISAPSSIGTTKIPSPSNGPNLPTKSWLQLNASATKRSRHYVPNFKFT